MKKLILTLALLSTASFASESNWVHITSNTTNTAFYGDAANIRYKNDVSEGELILLWIKSDHKRDKTVKWRETKSLWEINCQNYTYRLNQVINYRANGSVIKSHYRYGFDPFEMVQTNPFGKHLRGQLRLRPPRRQAPPPVIYGPSESPKPLQVSAPPGSIAYAIVDSVCGESE
jgi:hypothetical protein